MRAELYEEAGKFNHSNPDHVKRLWSAADAVVNAIQAIEEAEPKEILLSF